jgi:hypothetical protein
MVKRIFRISIIQTRQLNYFYSYLHYYFFTFLPYRLNENSRDKTGNFSRGLKNSGRRLSPFKTPKKYKKTESPAAKT